jgi:GTPase
MKNKYPKIVIFGRTNVGKSTLFNCLTEKKLALASDIEGTTRDSIIGEVEWDNKCFELIDTGGIMDLKFLNQSKTAKKKLEKTKMDFVDTVDDIDMQVQQQASDYIKKAKLILFVVDARDGVMPQDKEMILIIKKMLPNIKNVLLVANKVDSLKQRKELAEFNKLGIGEPIAISATTGSGTGDLLDIIVDKFKELKIKTIPRCEVEAQKKIDSINVGIIGKPNVGKSSLINSILEEDRIIVSSVAHTTREPQNTYIEYKDEIINLIDTAGISKRGQKSAKHLKTKNTLEKLSITKTLSSLANADICLLMIDINDGITHQEARIVQSIIENRISLIIVANKWDLIEHKDTKEYTSFIYDHLPFVRWAPIQFVSALTGSKVHNILDLVLEVDKARKTQVSDNALSKFLQKIIKRHKPAKAKGTKHPYVYELRQINTNPPKILVRIGSKDTIHFSYVRFIENRIREKFGFLGTPLNMSIEKNKRVHGQEEK